MGKLLKHHEVDATFLLPTKQICSMLHSTKDLRDPLTSAGVYRIRCSCGAVYIGTNGRSVKTRLTEHKRNCCLGQDNKSAVAGHAMLDGRYEMCYEDIEVLSRISHFHARLHREAIEIHKHVTSIERKSD